MAKGCYLSGCKTIDRNGKMEFLIIVSFNEPSQRMAYYKQRWQIETLFRGLKSSGFNIEDTHVTDLERLENYSQWLWLPSCGDVKLENVWMETSKNILIKKHGRRAVSVFKYGWAGLFVEISVDRLQIFRIQSF